MRMVSSWKEVGEMVSILYSMLLSEMTVMVGNRSISLLADRVASIPRMVAQTVKVLAMLKGPSGVLISV